MKSISFKSWCLLLLGISSFGAWTYMVYLDPSLRADYLQSIKFIFVGVVSLVLHDTKPS